jgi:hypothetical protein
MACPQCGLLCAIVEIGLVCPGQPGQAGCGGIRPFAAVWEFLQTQGPAGKGVSMQGVKPLLRKRFPGQIVQPRKASEIAPPYGGSSGGGWRLMTFLRRHQHQPPAAWPAEIRGPVLRMLASKSRTR